MTDFTWEDYNFERCEGIDFEGAKYMATMTCDSTWKLRISCQSEEAV